MNANTAAYKKSANAEAKLNATAPMKLKINNSDYNPESVPEYPEGKAVVLDGKTTPRARIKLFTSTSTEAVVTADANGNWEYSIDNPLPGDHQVEAEITDPITNLTSGRELVADFKVLGVVTFDENSPPSISEKTNLKFMILPIGIGVVAAVASFLILRRRRLQKKPLIKSGSTPDI